MRVFLGGTCNGSTWRDELIPKLGIEFFNPVVNDWTSECQEEEYRQKELCNIHLYCITSKMSGVFAIAEAIDSVHINNIRTLFHVKPSGFNLGQLKSLKAVADLIDRRGGLSLISENIEDSFLMCEVLGVKYE